MEVSGQIHAPITLPPTDTAPGPHWIGDFTGPTAGLENSD
jgi:hypothetical protein